MARVEKVRCLRCAQTTVGDCGGVRVFNAEKQSGREAEICLIGGRFRGFRGFRRFRGFMV